MSNKGMLVLALLFISCLCEDVTSSKKGPYTISDATTILSIKEATISTLSRYANLVIWYIENLVTLSPAQQDIETVHLMSIFCPQEYFYGFIGMNDPTLVTNRTDLGERFKATALDGAVQYPFNIDVYDYLVSDIKCTDSSKRTVTANVTAASRLFTQLLVAPATYNSAFFLGYYSVQVRISASGQTCISRMTDTTTSAYIIQATPLFATRWTLRV